MIEIKTIGVWGFEGSLRGCRMPYESFDKSDSGYQFIRTTDCIEVEKFFIGENDMKLCKKLIKAGSEHRKFMRMIHVQADVLAPRYWWAEADKYKWIEANSSSTMHLITKRELTMNDFSLDGTFETGWILELIERVNRAIRGYNKQKDCEEKEVIFREIKQFLPESYNQLRMIDTNYECLLNIYHQRKNHRLTEWHTFCEWCLTLPYFKEFVE